MENVTIENHKTFDSPHYFLITFVAETSKNDWDHPEVSWKIPEKTFYTVYKERKKWEEQVKQYVENGVSHMAGHCDKIYKVKTTYELE